MKRKTKNILEKEQLRSGFQKELLQTQLEIQEQTLKTISEEIHDNIGQVLSLAKLKLNTIDTGNEVTLKEKIMDSKNLVSKAIQDLRDLSRSLNTDNIASMGLLRALEYELEMIRKSGFETVLEIKGDTKRMEPQKELIVFRIIQETLNNIIKHAEAKRIMVTLSYNSDKLSLDVQDNGKGADMEVLADNEDNNKSLGLRNMKNRAKMIGAEFIFDSSPGKGTRVALVIPLNNQ
ncbi:MAG TPA: sensor histidine kinase [Chitinophagaceae bacterium]|nr:sensor histidine kinase [Chitinophagaceae bacterium]